MTTELLATAEHTALWIGQPGLLNIPLSQETREDVATLIRKLAGEVFVCGPSARSGLDAALAASVVLTNLSGKMHGRLIIRSCIRNDEWQSVAEQLEALAKELREACDDPKR